MKKIGILLIAMIILFSGCVNKSDVQPTPTGTPTQPSISEKTKKVINLAKEDLAKTLSVTAGDITLSNIEDVTWPDSSLGYPTPDGNYLTVMTSGYKIFLTYNNKTYEYHSDYERVVPPPAEKKEEH